MTRLPNPLDALPGNPFLYLPESNVMLNIRRIALLSFEGAPERPTCTVYIDGNIPPLKLHGRDVERVAETLHIDFQAMQTDLQQTQYPKKSPEL